MIDKRHLTPMLRQYLGIKEQHPDKLLLFRMGDFYEMFFDDAEKGASLLGITLTTRDKNKEQSVPLAGFPHHALEQYLEKLIRLGEKVVICEQMEDPKTAKGIVKRDVVDIITPGAVISDDEPQKQNYLAAIKIAKDQAGLALLDFATGEFRVTEIDKSQLNDELLRFQPREIVCSEKQLDDVMLLVDGVHAAITARLNEDFAEHTGAEILKNHFQVASLHAFDLEDRSLAVATAGAILIYLTDLHKESLHINKIEHYCNRRHLLLDSATIRNLELFRSLQDPSAKTSLYDIINLTKTPMGARKLRSFLHSPLSDQKSIEDRLDAVEAFIQTPQQREELRRQLKHLGDIERILAKLGSGRALPRDLVQLQNGLESGSFLHEQMQAFQPPLLQTITAQIHPFEDIQQQLAQALLNEPQNTLKEGGIIRPGYSQELDELRDLSHSGKTFIAQLQAQEQKRTGIPIKIGFNKIFGYYIEITKRFSDKIPDDYVRKQTLVNSERYIIPALKEYETKVLSAEEKSKQLEYDLFVELREQLLPHIPALQEWSQGIALLDVLLSFAELAVTHNYVRPQMVGNQQLHIQNGRHPVIEHLLPPGEFIPNTTQFDSQKAIHIITGPNMAGKSTYLRQVALIVLLAHCGSFVPAETATIGLVDRIFTRVGASDNLAAGLSTFLVEMSETANILRNASPRSLLILDEIGRGTSTFDGLSLAWAIVEYLHQHFAPSPHTLFATHYHELTDLETILPSVANYNITVKRTEKNILFLRKIASGSADQSYGIDVARLAGLPWEVIERAKEILGNLEANELSLFQRPKIAKKKQPKSDEFQLELFFPTPQHCQTSPILEELSSLNLNETTPLDALQLLFSWQKQLNDPSEK